ncbi:imidazole glycerol phosphate synthase subunit HisH [Allomuricauda sp. SCSIO 65647]|uniref:imidazole glycerol phosphate synthase subunit HisH n=1 Tax=Allomuricauda sp. SCSIO 65647 TaxID=2908843 RepID=UPI001F2F322F|nr:imidazole glycerol phosphate synthase subunit HisH [Muricauda sp. SCSIO 65647]UJH67247.1 imidazole glycerol phosphate synthase subunit HisH [Muricauda sp. SCSIO 65647]
MNLVIIDYGAGNIQSIQFAFQRLGVQAMLTNDSEEIINADKVIFPGVGEASSAMQKLRQRKLDALIPQLKQPVLGICLGMQLMCNSSEEGHTEGLGIFDTEVIKFNNGLKVPQIGWNQIGSLKTNLFKGLKENGYIYLVHSYYAPISKETVAVSNYGFEYSAALAKDNFYGVQFHPEKSGSYGAKILKNFLAL